MHTDTNHLDLVTTYFNAHASEWHDCYHDVKTVNDLVLIDRTKIAVGFVEKYLSPPAKILDAGCGAGLASLDLVQKGFFVHAMDLAERMVDLCAQNFGRRGIDPAKYTLTLGNILESNLPANSVDGIIGLGLLQYQADEARAVMALCDLLKPGGVLVLSGPARIRISNFFGLPDAIKARLRRRRAGAKVGSTNADIKLLLTISVNSYTVSRWKRILEQAGLTLVEHQGHGYVHFQIIGRWLNFRRALWLHRTLTKLAKVLPIDRFANDLVVVARKPA